MHLGEHLQETYAIEVNRDVTHKIYYNKTLSEDTYIYTSTC